MKTRNVTIRVSEEQFDYYNRLALHLKVDRSTMIKKAIETYSSSLNSEQDKTIKDRAVEVVSSTNRIADFNHPLLTVIESEGIKTIDDEGNTTARITNLKELLDFVNKNVFNYEGS